MGAADIVPGVSGGTVALVLGIYGRLINNIRIGARGLKELLTGDIAALKATLGKIEWIWIVSLLTGILVAVAALSSVLERLLDDEPVTMSGLFFGLVLGTIYVAYRMLDRVDTTAIGIIVGVGISLFLLLGLKSDTVVDDNAAEVVTKSPLIFLLVGAIAICAMILPGISGSFLLVMMGMYTEVLGAVNDRDFVSLGAFIVGAVLGLALFSTLLSWLLEHYRTWVIAAMVGLMLGSMRVLWPWPDGTNTTTLSAPSDNVVLPIVLAAVGIIAVVAVDILSRKYVDVDPID
jgi:putative membrane protein|tara:strand:+ start:364 stop:1233 length:870 start_codon:yes stop_codon:yes gene_type:complete